MNRAIAWAAAGVLLAAAPLAAHHTFSAEFDVTKPIKLTGSRVKWEMINPHSWFHVDVKEPDGKVVRWMIEGYLARVGANRAVGPIAMSVIVLVIILQILLFRSRWGLRTRAVGEHPKAADTVGVNVIRLRYRNVLMGGIFAGLAGAYLTLEATGSFQNNMTAGRGFIALAAMIFGRWTPLGAFGGALLFMGSQAIGVAIRLAPPAGDLGTLLAGIQQTYPSIYNNFFTGLPYLLTIIVLAGVVGRIAAIEKNSTNTDKTLADLAWPKLCDELAGRCHTARGAEAARELHRPMDLLRLKRAHRRSVDLVKPTVNLGDGF